MFDAYFTNESLIAGWGHSTREQGIEIWRDAGIKKLAMYHHHINCSDEELDRLSEELSALSENLVVANDGLELHL